MGLIDKLQNIFREPDEEEKIQKLIDENQRLRGNEFLHSPCIPQDEDKDNKLLNEVIKDVALALIVYEKAKGKISAEYTLYMLAEALNNTGKKYLNETKKRVMDLGIDSLDSAVEAEINRCKVYEEQRKNKS